MGFNLLASGDIVVLAYFQVHRERFPLLSLAVGSNISVASVVAEYWWNGGTPLSIATDVTHL
jgi:hypothetical protein